MRTEEEVRALYKQYVLKYAEAIQKGDTVASHQYFGASIACGRTLGKDVKRIKKDFEVAEYHINKELSKIS
jgi:hypothetical protein